MWICHRKEIRQLTFRALALNRIRSDEGPTLETSASESLYGGKITLLTQLIKPNYHLIKLILTVLTCFLNVIFLHRLWLTDLSSTNQHAKFFHVNKVTSPMAIRHLQFKKERSIERNDTLSWSSKHCHGNSNQEQNYKAIHDQLKLINM